MLTASQCQRAAGNVLSSIWGSLQAEEAKRLEVVRGALGVCLLVTGLPGQPPVVVLVFSTFCLVDLTVCLAMLTPSLAEDTSTALVYAGALCTWGKTFVLGFAWPEVMVSLAMHLVTWWMFHGMYLSVVRGSPTSKTVQFIFLLVFSLAGLAMKRLSAEGLPKSECATDCETKYCTLTMLTMAASTILMMCTMSPEPFDLEQECARLYERHLAESGACAGRREMCEVDTTHKDNACESSSASSSSSRAMSVATSSESIWQSTPEPGQVLAAGPCQTDLATTSGKSRACEAEAGQVLAPGPCQTDLATTSGKSRACEAEAGQVLAPGPCQTDLATTSRKSRACEAEPGQVLAPGPCQTDLATTSRKSRACEAEPGQVLAPGPCQTDLATTSGKSRACEAEAGQVLAPGPCQTDLATTMGKSRACEAEPGQVFAPGPCQTDLATTMGKSRACEAEIKSKEPWITGNDEYMVGLMSSHTTNTQQSAPAEHSRTLQRHGQEATSRSSKTRPRAIVARSPCRVSDQCHSQAGGQRSLSPSRRDSIHYIILSDRSSAMCSLEMTIIFLLHLVL
eukprot:TRINITY_DN9486_c0_g1_i1.p1 TRINITY_DN9486_c0_g1~~TRINITY_DN9486_c0_g1_i1.p1  ORF type:complete len:567 (+),score=48.48 TRINITY_DN9486_c0_g1_i1:85-1785(+)